MSGDHNANQKPTSFQKAPMKHAELAKYLNGAMYEFCEEHTTTTPEDILTALTLSLAIRCRMYGIEVEDVKANLDEIFKFTTPTEDETH